MPSLTEREAAAILALDASLRQQGPGPDHTGWSGDSQRAWRVSDGDGTPEYAVSSTVALAIRLAATTLREKQPCPT